MEQYQESILAVINVLNSVTLRVDQIESTGKISACVMKLHEILEGVNQGATDNQHRENV